jgi:Spy/CpxP family protein refolding chaperone
MEKAFGGAGGQFWNNPRIEAELKLTDDQRKAMDGIMQDHRLKLIDLQANLERAEVELGPLMRADTPDRAAILAQIDKVVAARAALEKANSLFLLDLRMQLTPAQWKQLQTMRENHMDRGRDGDRGQRGGWGQDGQGNQFYFHRQIPPAPPAPSAAPQGSPAPAPAPEPAPAPPGTGDAQ